MLIKNGNFAIDVGANQGIYTLLLAKLVGESGAVFSFEPSSREYFDLEKNLSLNRFKNIKSEKLALGDKDQKMLLKLAQCYASGQNTLLENFNFPKVDSEKSELVSVIKLDSYVKLKNISRVDFIKIDTEGLVRFLLKKITYYSSSNII